MNMTFEKRAGLAVRIRRLAAMPVMAGLFAGCSGGGSAEADASRLEAQVRELGEQQAGLLKRIDQLTQQREGELKVVVERLVDSRIQDLIQQKVDAAIAEKVGTSKEIDEVFQSTVKEQLAVYEEEKKKKEEESRQKMREEWEKRRQEESERRLTALARELNLNDAQKSQLKTLQDDMRTQVRTAFEKMREDGNFNFDTIRQQAEAMRDQHLVQARTFMSPEQGDAYQEKIGNLFRMFGMGQGRGGGGPGPGGGF